MRFAVATPVVVACLAFVSAAGRADYDPLAVGKFKPTHVDLSVRDKKRSRDIPLRIYLPGGSGAAPVILFSHGLGGSREGYVYAAAHWAARSYVVVALQHPGSDDGVWKDKPVAQRMSALRRAANVENFKLRVDDVPAVLDQLTAWNGAADHALSGRLDLKHVGMAGHSFGAVTTQAVSGQSFAVGGDFTDKRITAAVAMSPSSPRRGDAKQAFGGVRIPWLLLTGTADAAPIGDIDVQSRLAVFPALPPGGKYELVLDGAEHSAFSDRALPGDKAARNPEHHRAILALTTAFWDAYLRADPAAKAWLDGAGPRSIIAAKDSWRKK